MAVRGAYAQAIGPFVNTKISELPFLCCMADARVGSLLHRVPLLDIIRKGSVMRNAMLLIAVRYYLGKYMG